MLTIKDITSFKILNSRGDWTIKTRVLLSNGVSAEQAVPDGASKGEKEAVSLPANAAAEIVNTKIKALLLGVNAEDQKSLDNKLIELDGTEYKSNLGGNSTLSVSLAVARAVSVSREIQLYEYLHELYYGRKIESVTLPTPVFNIINGGKHAQNNLSFQEFMIIPSSSLPFDKAVEKGVTIYKDLKKKLKDGGNITSVGDEGGFAPENTTVRQALNLIRDAASISSKPGEDVFFGMDVAAESFYSDGKYKINEENLTLDSESLGTYYLELMKDFELIYLEDPFYENDKAGWSSFFEKASDKIMIVADDLVVTNPKILKSAINNKLANAVIVKPNQIGTLSETLEFIRLAKDAGMSTCVSHRSGDTAEDTFISDLAVGVKSEFIKSGALARGERVVKYNRLLEIFYSIA